MLLDTPVCDFGWQAPGFTLRDPAGQAFTMKDCLGKRGLLVAFICNHCPYVQRIANRLATDTSELTKAGIGVVAIMPNDYRTYGEDSPENMVLFARKSGFRFPYLVDEDQTVARAFGAVCTPDFFGLDKDGCLQYRGRLDDARMDNPAGRTRELVNAMNLIAETGNGPREQTPSMGCSIKWRDDA